ncbi:hypothetical protein [Rhizobium ruizarguesonis]|uniref:hypothetical protein n=1 Tax=Rhizobium ruizarguesonis TaxID=2081791 RepID=UPI0018D56B82|nr:hypothetical protein [Rhizobium ruizarguesonis]
MDCGSLLRAWARGESTTKSQPVSPPQRQEEQGAGYSQAPAPSHDRDLLTEYHKLLAGEIDTNGLKASHATFKPRFGDDQATIAAAGQILKAHNARLRGDADADQTAVYVEGLIEEGV